MLLALLALSALAAPSFSEPHAGAPRAQPMEEALWADLDARLADPAAYQARVEAQAEVFYEGRLFPYVLPVLALANRSRASDADLPKIRGQMASLIDALIPAVARRVRAPSFGAIPDARGHGTWLGQLALALGAWRLAGGDDRYEALHAGLCATLLGGLQARAGAPIDSYPGLTWTFDTTPALLALRLRDRSHGLPGAEEAIGAHLAWLKANADPATGLPPSRVEPDSGRILEGPRGADLGLRITLWAQLDAREAGALYSAFVQHFALQVGGLEGFAEWPGGQAGRPDADSGPVLAGLGLSSTGFGLGAAKAAGDTARFARLERQLRAFPGLLAQVRPLLAPQLHALGMTLDTDAYTTGLLLGDLAVLWGLSWTSWGAEGPRTR